MLAGICLPSTTLLALLLTGGCAAGKPAATGETAATVPSEAPNRQPTEVIVSLTSAGVPESAGIGCDGGPKFIETFGYLLVSDGTLYSATFHPMPNLQPVTSEQIGDDLRAVAKRAVSRDVLVGLHPVEEDKVTIELAAKAAARIKVEAVRVCPTGFRFYVVIDSKYLR